MAKIDRLALGTAQFGLAYGIANRGGQIASAEAAQILGEARRAGVDTLDTAIVYGDAEQQLGDAGVLAWRVVSKLPRLPKDVNPVTWVSRQIRDSLARLRIPKLYGLLLHQPSALFDRTGATLHAALLAAKERGLVEKIGISAYGPDEIAATLDRFAIDMVQAPLSVVDRRLIDSGCLARMHDANIEFHARSVFLQGLLLMDRGQRPAAFSHWEVLWNSWHTWLEFERISAVEACMGFVMSRPEVSRVVVGIDGLAHLRELLATARHTTPLNAPASLASADPQLIIPSNWRLQ